MEKREITPRELSAARHTLGALSWKAQQTGPQFCGDVSLLLSELSAKDMATLRDVNKLVRDVKRTASQKL
eukprot:5292816-Alexandrium_andersonii.AAC.1